MKVRRVLKGKVIGGVCTGLAQEMKIDVTFIRILFLIVAILTLGWLMAIIYFGLWFLMGKPVDEYVQVKNPKNELIIYFSAFLIGIGSLMLLMVFVPFNFFKYTLPIGFILVGAFMLYLAVKKKSNG